MERPPSSQTFGPPGRTTPQSTHSTNSAREINHILQEQARMQLEVAAIKGDVTELIPRVATIENRVGAIEDRVANLEVQVARMDRKLSRLETKVEGLDTKVERLDGKMDQVLAALVQPQVAIGGRASMSVPDLPTTSTTNSRERNNQGGGTRKSRLHHMISELSGALGRIVDNASHGLNQINQMEQRGIPEEDERQRQQQPTAGPSRSVASRSGQQQAPPRLGQQIVPDRR
ncbi:hypothetical protein FKP32DRAFT_1590813 [Trametes sanguinea]|nr:hypothetical protein FKP32DRAFT_1590813 [Trametes sanguinea]